MAEEEMVGRVGRALYAFAIAGARHPIDFLKYVGRQGAAYERYRALGRGDVDRAADALIDERVRLFLSSPPSTLLPQRSLDELCPGGATPSAWQPHAGDGSELPEVEQQAVARIAATQRPRTIFEIGTYRGQTTALLAECSPAATVHTLDLPPEKMREGGCFQVDDRGLIGALFMSNPRIRARIVQHFGDSRQFNFESFYGQMDLVFVDASHAYEAVIADSRQAFRLIRKGGVILWDDYHPIHGLGVMRALAETADEHRILWITGTRLAVHWPESRTDR